MSNTPANTFAMNAVFGKTGGPPTDTPADAIAALEAKMEDAAANIEKLKMHVGEMTFRLECYKEDFMKHAMFMDQMNEAMSDRIAKLEEALSTAAEEPAL